MKKEHRKISAKIMLGVLLLTGPFPSMQAAQLTACLASENTRGEIDPFTRLASYVKTRLKKTDVSTLSVQVAETPREVFNGLQKKKIDWASTSSLWGLFYVRETGAEIGLRRWKDGVPDCTAMFFVGHDSRIHRFTDLIGKKIAFTHPHSSFGYLIPLALLRKNGLSLVALASPRDKVPVGKVGFFFSGSSLDSCILVDQKYADAAVITDLDWDNLDVLPTAVKKDFRVFYQTEYWPQWVEVFRKDLNPETKRKIVAILREADQDESGKKILDDWEQTARYDRLPEKSQLMLKKLGALLDFVRKDEILK